MYKFLKRTIDLVLSSLVLVATSPFLVLTSILIKFDSEGPVFVEVSHRVGKDGKLFRMYKFRTMVANAHEEIKRNPQYKKLMEKWKKNSFKLDRDPRITRIGRFLRRYSIDEFPQLLNVLKGEMSLVGPRALYPEELEMQKKLHSDLVPLLEEVTKVKPGASGVWQVSGRSEISFRERAAMDADYAKNPSLLTDLKVIFKTLPAIISGKGAQ
ncbi:MAG: sugar transferase [bacterium]|nr:sugar transferase [bacterium]